MKHTLKRRALGAARALGAIASARWLLRNRTLVLTYHGVLPTGMRGSDYLDSNFVGAEQFERQLQYLRRHYTALPMREFVSSLDDERPLPARAVLVTFDDGFANNFEVAYPILRSQGIPFTVFLTTGLVGRPGARLWTERVKRAIYRSPRTRVEVALPRGRCRFELGSSDSRERASRSVVAALKRMGVEEREQSVVAIEAEFEPPPPAASEGVRYDFLNWDQVRAMASSGVEFGSHTTTHPILSTLDERSLREELSDSKALLEQHTGKPCGVFAYPNGGVGDFGPREQRMLAGLGYRCAFTQLGGFIGPHTDRFAVPRMNVGRNFDELMFASATAGLLTVSSRVGLLVQPGRRHTPDPAATELQYVD